MAAEGLSRRHASPSRERLLPFRGKDTIFAVDEQKAMERFFSLKHLTGEQLRDLYREAVGVGTLLVEYDRPGDSGHYDVRLPEDDILQNIRPGEGNHIVYHKDSEDFPDAVTVVFPMVEHPFITVYVDFDNSLLDRFAAKYALAEWWQMEGDKQQAYPFAAFYTTPEYSWNFPDGEVS